MNNKKDTWKIGNHEFTSRFILGSGKYSLDLIKAAVEQVGGRDHHPGSSPGKRRRGR